MKDLNKVIKSAITGVLASSLLLSGAALAQEKAEKDELEKCYGISKAGKNDCQTSTASCAGSATQDRQPDAFILVPKGICSRIVGGSLESGKK